MCWFVKGFNLCRNRCTKCLVGYSSIAELVGQSLGLAYCIMGDCFIKVF